ncbi:anaerobic glycerol-3-phosphate dehydrogenase subunit C [Mergibacter septicus]|uniref:anaerobic glycerol-3-phosphate dehydrogenase subunit GlpC n=1 Tax=Mergibacter septicus TaxID=221402 RepID=UPI001179371D|nr:anaerobic glycerol-3-phosphate dehydrogenase subunit GlpC [Mergibacter septicus]AWX14098.1 anaerobic glycerol-3-phosphate dehydrogenase subunit C [Mergibacter septicus]
MNLEELLAQANKTQPQTYSDQSFESCIKCTACTAVCPVSRNNPLYPGPKQSGPDGERLRLKNPSMYDEALKYCTNCKRCEVACPSGVKIGDIIVRARDHYGKGKGKTKTQKLRDAVLSNTDLMGTLSTPFAPIINTITGLKATRFILDKTLKVDRRRSLPKYSFGTFRYWYKKQAEEQTRFVEKVAYYHGCYVNYNNPELGKDLIKVFNAMNIGVVLLEKEKCCGVPLMVNGFPQQATRQANFNIQQLEKVIVEKSLPVVGTSSTCTLTLKEEYEHILGINNSKVKGDIHLVTRYIYRLLEEQGKKLPLKSLPLKVAYHTACHMEKAGWVAYTIELLRKIPNLELTMLNSQCCGIAGTYGFKAENYEVSQAIGSGLFEQINQGSFDYIISDCETCKWQIDMSTNCTCLHPITLLAMALA